MSLESCSTFTNGDIIEICQPGHNHWAVYVGDGYIVHLNGRIVGCGDAAVHGESNIVEKTKLETEAKGCNVTVTNKYHDLIPVPSDEMVKTALQMVGESKPYGSSCRDFALELKYGRGNLDIIIRNLASIPGELTVAAANIVQKAGSAVNSSSDIVGSVAAKGVEFAGQGLTAVSGVVGAVAGKGVAAFGNMLSTGVQTLGPTVAATVGATGYGSMLLTAAEYISPLAETLAAQSAEAEEATANSVRELGSSLASNSASVGSAVASGLSWFGSASAAGASSLLSYLKSGTEQASPEQKTTTELPDKSDDDIQK